MMIRWVEHVACLVETTEVANAKVYLESMKGRCKLRELDIDGRNGKA
jgi:hypothetical protein